MHTKIQLIQKHLT